MKGMFILIAALLSGTVFPSREVLKITKMTVNDVVNPVCVNSVRLGWQTGCPVQGARQAAYEIRVSEGGRQVYGTGMVKDDDQTDIELPVEWEQGKLYKWRVRVWDGEGRPSEWSPEAEFGTAINDSWEAGWICTGQRQKADPLPYVRKTFILKGKKVRRAMAYVCGLGCGELWVNSRAVDPSRVMDPAQTDYGKRALYSAFDVTGLLKPGKKNCLGVMLGKGWFTQDSVWGDEGLSYGMPILRCQLNIEYADGTSEKICTDQTWLWTEGPITRSNVYQGEDYDARLAIEGWTDPDLDDGGWKRCIPATGLIPERMEAQEIAPIRRMEPVKPVAMWKAPGDENRWIYDFGENRTANVRFDVTLPRGTKLTVRGAETITKDRDLDFRSVGTRFVGYQTDSYICSGALGESWTPRFTYHGFRYLDLTVEGTDEQPSETWLSMVPVHTDVEDRGWFECSDSQLNALHALARRTFLNCFVGVPVDCAHREKCGWLGDTHAYDLAADLNFQMNGFWMKYLGDIRTTADRFEANTLHHKLFNAEFYFSDKASGIPYMIAPGQRLCGVASPDWGTAVVQLPWHLYLYFGNRKILEDYYDMMGQWAGYIDGTAVEGIVYEGLGDWCPPRNDHYHNPTPVEFSSTCFHFIDLTIMEKVAALLGKAEDRRYFAERREYTREALIRKFYNPMRHGFGSQTADVMAIMAGLVPEGEEEAVAEDFFFDVSHTPFGFLNMGIFGLGRFGSALSRNGHAGEAFGLFTKKGENSWGFMLDSLKVTTLWEQLPYTQADAEDMAGSLCHPMSGGFDIWFYEDVLGIRPVEEAPGFKKVILDPLVTGYMKWARGSVETAYGPVSSDWRNEGEDFVWKISVPANATALVTLPTGKPVSVNGRPLELKPSREGTASAVYEFDSGEYEIRYRSLIQR